MGPGPGTRGDIDVVGANPSAIKGVQPVTRELRGRAGGGRGLPEHGRSRRDITRVARQDRRGYSKVRFPQNMRGDGGVRRWLHWGAKNMTRGKRCGGFLEMGFPKCKEGPVLGSVFDSDESGGDKCPNHYPINEKRAPIIIYRIANNRSQMGHIQIAGKCGKAVKRDKLKIPKQKFLEGLGEVG